MNVPATVFIFLTLLIITWIIHEIITRNSATHTISPRQYKRYALVVISLFWISMLIVQIGEHA